MLSTITDLTATIKKTTLQDFEFNWKKPASNQSVVYAAMIANEIAGLVEFERLTSELDSQKF